MLGKNSILSIETSGSTCGVCLSINGELYAEFSIYKGGKHDKFLAEYVRRILNDAGMTPEELSAVAISSGPGSFTGLRIGGAFAKALCFSGEPKLIAVPALSACAYAAKETANLLKLEKIVAVVSSHKNLCYVQEFSSQINILGEIQIVEKTDVFKLFGENVLYCGPGVNEIKAKFKTLNEINASMISKYAEKLFSKGVFVASNEYDPMYVQEFEPKISMKKI